MSTGLEHTTTATRDAGRETPLMVFSADTHVGPGPRRCGRTVRRSTATRSKSSRRAIDQYQEMFFKTTFSAEHRNGRRRNAADGGALRPAPRLQDMDRDGVAGGAIFAESLNGQPFPFDYDNRIASGVPAPEARELAGVGRAMYNRWLADFCSVEPERNVGLAQLPFWDIDAVMAELEWAAEHGLRGINFPSPGQPGLFPVRDPGMDRFFAACASLDMTLATHIGATPPSRSPSNPSG